MKKIPYSLLSGIVAIALFFAPFANTVTYAAEGENVRDDNYDVRSDNYDEDDYDDGYADGEYYGSDEGYVDALYGYDKNPNANDYLDGDEELGYTLGFKDGFEIGYEEGYLEGLEDYDPYEVGYFDGDLDGFDAGFDDGYEGKKKDDSFDLDGDVDEKYKEGYTEGYTDGYEVGYQRGKEFKEEEESGSGIYSEGKDTVTGETYFNYLLDTKSAKQYQDKDGNLKTEKTNWIDLHKDVIKSIKDHAIFTTVNGTSIKFPKAALEQILNYDDSNSAGVYFEFNNVTNEYKNSLSEAIKFYISNDYVFEGDLDSPITVSFFVDKDKVKNWEDLTLIYVDEDGKETNYANQVKSINPETGEVVVEINHFSTYYIAEVAGKGAGPDVIVKPGQGGPGDEDSNNGKGESSSDNKEVHVEAGDDNGSTDTDGQTLPNTATNSYNLLLAGALSLALGLGAIVLYRRKKAL